MASVYPYHLPPELWSIVFTYLGSAHLDACSVVRRSWTPYAQRELFKRVQVCIIPPSVDICPEEWCPDDEEDEGDLDDFDSLDYGTAGPGARIRDLKEFLGFLTTHPHLRSHIRGLKVVGPYGPSDDPWVVERISRVCDLTVFLGILELLPRLRRLNLDYILFPAGTTVPQDAPYFDIKNVAIRMPFIRYEGPQLPTSNDVLKFLCLFGKVERLWLDCRLVKDKSEGQVIIPSVLQVKTLVMGELVFSSKILCGLQKSRALDQLSALRIGSIDYYTFTTRVRGPLQDLLHHVAPRLTDFQCGVEGTADDFLQGGRDFAEILCDQNWENLVSLAFDAQFEDDPDGIGPVYWSQTPPLLASMKCPNLTRLSFGVQSYAWPLSIDDSESWDLKPLEDVLLGSFPNMRAVAFLDDLLDVNIQEDLQAKLPRLQKRELLDFSGSRPLHGFRLQDSHNHPMPSREYYSDE